MSKRERSDIRRPRTVLAIVLALVVATGATAVVADATGPGKNGQIVFRHYRSLFVVNADGTGERKLTHPRGEMLDSQPDWSPDGSKIAFMRCVQSCQVWSVNASGTGLRRLGPCCDDRGDPAWSPTGKQIAYSRGWGRVENDQIERTEIFLMNAGGGAARSLTRITAAKPFSAVVGAAAWSPNGKQLVFAVRNSKLGEPANGRAIFVINADGSGQRQLTPWSLNGGGRLDWSPDGELILFRVAGAKDQHGNIYTIHPDGSGLTQLTRYPAPKIVELGSFSPDGNWITFSRFSPGSAYPAVFALRIDGTGIRRVTKTDINFSPDWGRAR